MISVFWLTKVCFGLYNPRRKWESFPDSPILVSEPYPFSFFIYLFFLNKCKIYPTEYNQGVHVKTWMVQIIPPSDLKIPSWWMIRMLKTSKRHSFRVISSISQTCVRSIWHHNLWRQNKCMQLTIKRWMNTKDWATQPRMQSLTSRKMDPEIHCNNVISIFLYPRLPVGSQ